MKERKRSLSYREILEIRGRDCFLYKNEMTDKAFYVPEDMRVREYISKIRHGP